MAVDCTILAFVQFGSIALANPTCRHCGVLDKATNDGGQARSLIFTDIQGDSAVPRSPTTSPPAVNAPARYYRVRLVAVSAVADWGPCNDKTELPQLLAETQPRVVVRELYAEAGYDAEGVHQWCRDGVGIRSWIPPAVHRADGTAGGYWRSGMAQGLPPRYGRR